MKTKTINKLQTLDNLIISDISKSKKELDEFVKISFAEYNKDKDIASLLDSLRVAIKAHSSFKEIAEHTGLGRESLYKSISRKGNPTLKTISAILSCLNLKIDIKETA